MKNIDKKSLGSHKNSNKLDQRNVSASFNHESWTLAKSELQQTGKNTAKPGSLSNLQDGQALGQSQFNNGRSSIMSQKVRNTAMQKQQVINDA